MNRHFKSYEDGIEAWEQSDVSSYARKGSLLHKLQENLLHYEEEKKKQDFWNRSRNIAPKNSVNDKILKLPLLPNNYQTQKLQFKVKSHVIFKQATDENNQILYPVKRGPPLKLKTILISQEQPKKKQLSYNRNIRQILAGHEQNLSRQKPKKKLTLKIQKKKNSQVLISEFSDTKFFRDNPSTHKFL